jgi:hypothetical protein
MLVLTSLFKEGSTKYRITILVLRLVEIHTENEQPPQTRLLTSA